MKKGFSSYELTNFLTDFLKSKDVDVEKKVNNVLVLDSIRNSWKTVAPPALFEHTVIAKFTNKTVYLQADHGIYAQEIQLLSSQLCKALSKETALEIRDMKIRVGPLYHKSGKRTDIMSQSQNMSTIEEHPNKSVLDKLIRKTKK
ncbi:MAG: DUF721 domain-containing protein [Leptospirales bacterium]